MFGIGPSEFVVIAIVAILVLGPEHLPKVMRTFNKAMSDFRRVSTDLQRTLNMEAHQEELNKQKAEAAKKKRAAKAKAQAEAAAAAEAAEATAAAEAANPLVTPGGTPGTDLAEAAAAPAQESTTSAEQGVHEEISVTAAAAEQAPSAAEPALAQQQPEATPADFTAESAPAPQNKTANSPQGGLA